MSFIIDIEKESLLSFHVARYFREIGTPKIAPLFPVIKIGYFLAVTSSSSDDVTLFACLIECVCVSPYLLALPKGCNFAHLYLSNFAPLLCSFAPLHFCNFDPWQLRTFASLHLSTFVTWQLGNFTNLQLCNITNLQHVQFATRAI